jgi:hypothetical protein
MNHAVRTPAARARLLLLAGLIVALQPVRESQGIIEISMGNDPVRDSNWPAGAVEVANLKTRIAATNHSGLDQFLYRGDAAAFQEALDLLAKVKAPEVRLVIHPGTHEPWFLKNKEDPKADKYVDWTFSVWDAEYYHRVFNGPHPRGGVDHANRGAPLAPPQLDVYVGRPGGVDWSRVKVPQRITATDERASAAGIDAGGGGVVLGELYDMTTSKPLADARVTVDKRKGQGDEWEQVASAQADADGKFKLTAIPPGSYRVIASAEGYAPRYLASVDLQKDTLERCVAYLCAPAGVTGTVKDHEGRPLAGVKVSATSVLGLDGQGYSPAGKTEATTDAKGQFTLGGLPRGQAEFRVYGTSFYQLAPRGLQPVPSEVALRMTPTGAVRGKVVTAEGNPFDARRLSPHGNLTVTIEPTGFAGVGSWGGAMNVKPDGTFVFETVPPGKYVVGLILHDVNPNAKFIEVKAGDTVQVELTHP